MARPKSKPDEKGRKTRVPFGNFRSKLQVTEGIKGYVLRWFNDQDGRIEQAVDGGYEFVSPDEVSGIGQGELHQENSDVNARVSKIVSRGATNPIRAYLMKIKKEWYDEDQRAKEGRNQMIDDALRRGEPGGNVVDRQYVPRGHRQRVN